ncbi:hypothetical protein H6P81_010399 [Aristolochia fimbriata]|uniref:Uncharacterized protein n=1 Tax=Aristolochia fimbriata TaxID=158543 RepID=A0AAV7EPE3_ARIFI|nr:hypothetical protein H6P81_010399 [Aristolochia fimbriata]
MTLFLAATGFSVGTVPSLPASARRGWRRSPSVCELVRQLAEERDLVGRAGIHEEVKRVHPLPPPGRRAVEHAHPVSHGDGNDLVYEENAGVADGFLRGRRRGSFHGDTDAESPESVVHERHRKERSGGYPQAREKEPDRHPENDDQSQERRGFLHEPAVVEDDGLRKLIARDRLQPRVRRHDVALPAELHERKIRLPVTESNFGRRSFSKVFAECGGLDRSNENPRVSDESRGPTLISTDLRPHDQIGSQVLLQKGFHHHPGIRRQHAPLPTRGEDAPRLRVQVHGVELGEDRSSDGLDVGDLHPHKAREDENLYACGFRDEVVEDPGEWGGQEKGEEPQQATHLEGHESEVREGTPATEEGAVHVRHHRVFLPPDGVAPLHRRKLPPSFCSHIYIRYLPLISTSSDQMRKKLTARGREGGRELLVAMETRDVNAPRSPPKAASFYLLRFHRGRSDKNYRGFRRVCVFVGSLMHACVHILKMSLGYIIMALASSTLDFGAVRDPS